jgi:hypothetical protein
MDSVTKISNAYIEGTVLYGTVNGEAHESIITRGAALIQVGDVYNTNTGVYEIESVRG